VRNAVEFVGLVCHKTRSQSNDEASLVFNDVPIWSGNIRDGATAKLQTISVMPESSAVLRLWQLDPPNRTISCLGRETVQYDAAGQGTQTARFTRDGAEYDLSYKFLQVPD
jgi:hypothetical protein